MKIEIVSYRLAGENSHCIIKADGKWYEDVDGRSPSISIGHLRSGSSDGFRVISEADAKMKIGRMLFSHE